MIGSRLGYTAPLDRLAVTNTFLQRFTNVRREEVLPALVAGLFFFCVLAALMVVRPAREALGMQRGIETLRWLFMGTVLVTLLVNPVFGWLVSRFRHLVFINATYLFFAFGLAAFYLLLALAPASIGERTGQVFYVWFSVFNLFATMLFWALMADRFTLEQSKRLFGAIAVGGTLGAIFGPWLASQLARPLGTPALLLIAAGFLVLALGAAWWLSSLRPEAGHAPAEDVVIGGSAWEGLQAVVRSPYLLAISRRRSGAARRCVDGARLLAGLCAAHAGSRVKPAPRSPPRRRGRQTPCLRIRLRRRSIIGQSPTNSPQRSACAS